MQKEEKQNKLTKSQIEECLTARKMKGVSRRAFQAEMCLKYCDGNARYAETLWGWGRHTVELGLSEKRSGIMSWEHNQCVAEPKMGRNGEQRLGRYA